MRVIISINKQGGMALRAPFDVILVEIVYMVRMRLNI